MLEQLRDQHSRSIGAIVALNRLEMALDAAGANTPDVLVEICSQRRDHADERDRLRSEIQQVLRSNGHPEILANTLIG